MILYVVQEENLKWPPNNGEFHSEVGSFLATCLFLQPQHHLVHSSISETWEANHQLKNVVTIQYVNLSTYFSIKQSIDSVNYWFNPHFLVWFTTQSPFYLFLWSLGLFPSLTSPRDWSGFALLRNWSALSSKLVPASTCELRRSGETGNRKIQHDAESETWIRNEILVYT